MDMRNEIRSCRRSGGERGGLPWGEYLFPLEFPGFSGHFPGMPVLPGVCLLKTAAVTLEDWHGRPILVSEVSRARFSAPVKPGEPVEVACTRSESAEGRFTAVMRFGAANGGKPSTCTLRYTLCAPSGTPENAPARP